MAKKKKQKQKLEVVFDPKSRREFLTGFRKRKNERKKRAKDELEKMLDTERKRIRLEVKDSVKNLKQSYAPIPELQHLLDEKEYEDDAVKVKIVDMSGENLASGLEFIGDNKPEADVDEAKAESDASSDDEEEVPGMGTAKKKVKVNKKPDQHPDLTKIKTKKDLNRLTKKTARKSFKTNKVFKMKSKLDSVAARKKAKKEKFRKEKAEDNQRKRKGKFKKRRK